MPTLKFLYFDGKGRGEPCRWMLAATQLPHEEDRFTLEQWPAIQPSTPYGQAPVLVVDGKPLAQTVAISRYVGTLGGLVCADQFQNARGNEMVDTMAELGSKWFDVRLEEDAKKKAVDEAEMYATYIPKVFRTFESRISTKFLLSDKLSWQDVYIGHFLSRIFEVRPDALQPYPKLKRVMENVLALEGIKKYLASPRNYTYPQF